MHAIITKTTLMYCISNSCIMGPSDLPDIYTQTQGRGGVDAELMISIFCCPAKMS